MKITIKHSAKYIFAITALLFSIQMMLQSIPIAQKIIINGESMCTCGCGHTIAKCVENHGSKHSKCSCQHEKDENVHYVFTKNIIGDIIINKNIQYHFAKAPEIYSIEELLQFNQFITKIITPPPKTNLV